jgi:hypothetical protein
MLLLFMILSNNEKDTEYKKSIIFIQLIDFGNGIVYYY